MGHFAEAPADSLLPAIFDYLQGESSALPLILVNEAFTRFSTFFL